MTSGEGDGEGEGEGEAVGEVTMGDMDDMDGDSAGDSTGDKADDCDGDEESLNDDDIDETVVTKRGELGEDSDGRRAAYTFRDGETGAETETLASPAALPLVTGVCD